MAWEKLKVKGWLVKILESAMATTEIWRAYNPLGVGD
jgi:hypothetical protein